MRIDCKFSGTLGVGKLSNLNDTAYKERKSYSYISGRLGSGVYVP